MVNSPDSNPTIVWLIGDNDYTRWANYSTTFIFKPERYVELNGTEIVSLNML